jgi:hypothetical protein
MNKEVKDYISKVKQLPTEVAQVQHNYDLGFISSKSYRECVNNFMQLVDARRKDAVKSIKTIRNCNIKEAEVYLDGYEEAIFYGKVNQVIA